MNNTIAEQIKNSSYRNVYWFARYLIDTDKYGALGKNKEAHIMNIVSYIERLLSDSFPSPEDRFTIAKEYLIATL